MNVGFTGTRQGMTYKQFSAFIDLIACLHPDEFHHGDCVGADEQAGNFVAADTATHVVIHPPQEIGKNRAWCVGHEFRDPLPYLARNHKIVDETDLLIATPKTRGEELRSGTWATIRYARRKGRPVRILFP